MRSFPRAAVSLALASVPSVAVAADLENASAVENDARATPAAAAAQKPPVENRTPSAPAPGKPANTSPDGTPAEKPRETSFAVVPGPFYNPNLGAGVNVIPMLMFHPNKSDAVSPPSIALLNLLYAIKPPFDEAKSRQSFVMTAATRLFLDEDRWRVVGIAGYINLFQEFSGVGGGADLRTLSSTIGWSR